MNIQTVKNVSDCVPLYLPHSLYLNPFVRLNISVSLPQTVTGKTISNWDVMEKLRKMIQPDQFSVLKVSKSTLEFIRFDAELEELSKLKNVLSRLDGRPLKLSAFPEPLKIRASQAKDNFPSRHDWDSFFRDTRDMDEMKAGERPDTMHITNLPIRWFCPRHLENEENVKPSESIFKRIFEKFGDVRVVDIPICDPYRKDMKAHMTGMKTFSFDQELYFEGYVQFMEYIGFVKAMDEFRGMKLVRKEGDRNLATNIVVDFDRTKHLSDANVKRRKILRDRFIARDRAKEEEDKKRQKAIEEEKDRERRRKESEKMAEIERQREREEKRKEKHLKKLRDKEQEEMSQKIRIEEKKLLVAQRKLESIRVLGALFDRIKLNTPKNVKIKKEGEKSSKGHHHHHHQHHKMGKNHKSELIDKEKIAQQHEIRKLQNRLKKVKSGTAAERSPSVNTISSDDSVLSDSAQKKKRKLKKRKKNDSSSSSTSLSTEPEDITNKLIPAVPAVPPAFPMFDPETGQWMGVPFGMYPFATAPFLPGTSMMRPDMFGNPMFRGGRGRGRFPRQRGRSGYRSRGSYSHNSYDRGYHDYDDEHDHRNSRSRSRGRRSRSRSHSRSRHYHRSRKSSRSRRSRTRSRSKSSKRSHSRSRSRSKSKSKQKLVSTLRKSNSTNRWSSRSRSRSRSRRRSRSKRSWSREARSHSPSHTPKRPYRNTSPNNKIVLEPEKLVRSAREIQKSVQQKLMERVQKEEKEKKEREQERFRHTNEKEKPSASRERSLSVDSSKFISPKRKQPEDTSEKELE